MPDNSKLKIQNFKLPILVGPTGVGKSEIAYQLAQKLKMEIISADAFQVYRGTEVGTAQPSIEWQKKVRHHLIGLRDPRDNWNAVEFARQASKILKAGLAQGKRFLVVGGAGFYLRALIEGAPAGSSPDIEVREMVSEKAKELGNEGIYSWLKVRDPASAERLHPNDTQRICRALEKTFKMKAETQDYKSLGEANVRLIGFERSRENLDRILQSRTSALWAGGLLTEAKRLMELPLPADHPLWGAIGYSESAAHLQGKMTQEEALEKIFRRTRQYAKRQWTWFKHQHKVDWINLDEFPDLISAVNLVENRIGK